MTFLSDIQKQRLFDLGYTLSHHGKILEANCIFDAFLKENPKEAKALIGKAHAFLVIDKFAEAESLLKQVVENNPKDQEALAMLALNYFLMDDQTNCKTMAELVDDTDNVAYLLSKELLAFC